MSGLPHKSPPLSAAESAARRRRSVYLLQGLPLKQPAEAACLNRGGDRRISVSRRRLPIKSITGHGLISVGC